jgi:hypothetical protein
MAESAESSTPGGSAKALKVVTIVWLAATAVHLLIWLIMCLATFSFHSPFWIWPLIGGAVIVVPWYFAIRSKSKQGVVRS